MKKSLNNHTTVVLLLNDGTHRYLNATHELSNKQVWDFVRDQMRYASDNSRGVTIINEMYLACGQQSLRYTWSEVVELAAKV